MKPTENIRGRLKACVNFKHLFSKMSRLGGGCTVFMMKHVLLNIKEGGHSWKAVVLRILFQFQLLACSTQHSPQTTRSCFLYEDPWCCLFSKEICLNPKTEVEKCTDLVSGAYYDT